jgi:hypothetical protein
LRRALLFPGFSQFREYRSRSAVFFLIGQHAAFGERAKAVKINAGFQQIFRIEREDCDGSAALSIPGA